jgi:hypothetical protein
VVFAFLSPTVEDEENLSRRPTPSAEHKASDFFIFYSQLREKVIAFILEDQLPEMDFETLSLYRTEVGGLVTLLLAWSDLLYH